MKPGDWVMTSEGKRQVVLVYNDAIASGTQDYVNITQVAVKDPTDNSVKHIYPREISQHSERENGIRE